MKAQTVSALLGAFLVPALSFAHGHGAHPGYGTGSGTPAAVGPANGIYITGEPHPLVPLLNSAQSSIDIEIYTMGNKQVRDALRAALARKVRVRIIKDSAPMQDPCSVFPDDIVKRTGGASAAAAAPTDPKVSADCEDQKKLVNDVNASGGSYIPYNKPALCRDNSLYCFEHGKIALVDAATSAATALVSTGNFDDTNLCDSSSGHLGHCDRDYTLITRDPQIVRSLSAVYAKDFVGQKYDLQSMLGSVVSKSVTVSPYSVQPLVDFLKSAQRSVQIQEQYLKDATIVSTLTEIAKAGKQVSIQVASACAYGKPAGKDADDFRATYTQLEEAGAKIRIFSGDQQILGHTGYLHAKAIVIDGSRAWVGSTNISETSLTNNREYGVFLSDAGQIARVRAQMDSDFQDPRTETWQESLDCQKDPTSLELK